MVMQKFYNIKSTNQRTVFSFFTKEDCRLLFDNFVKKYHKLAQKSDKIGTKISQNL